MREVKERAGPYTAAQMFALVEDIERYPQFLPWVAAAQAARAQPERSRRAAGNAARRNARDRHHSQCADPAARDHADAGRRSRTGPFKTLEGRWTFEPIGEDRGTRVSLSIRFEFTNAMLNLLLSRSFEKSCNELVDAFVARGRAVYGAR